MRALMRKLCIGVGLAVCVAVFTVPARPALADNGKTLTELKKLAREAMENYDLMEYETAKKLLNKAIALAKKKRMGDNPLTAQLYLHLGIVYFSGFSDVESAKVAFIDAVSIDPQVVLNPAYKTGEMEKLLAEAKSEFGGRSGGHDSGGDSAPAEVDDVNCGALVGVAHTLVDSGKTGTNTPIMAHVSADLGASKVTLFYRPDGKADFSETSMKKQGGCKFVGTIPGKAMRGEVVHYYIGVFNKGGKLIAKKGSAASPNIIELEAGSGSIGAAGSGGDTENPLGGGGGDHHSSGGEVHRGVSKSGPNKFFVGVALGTGGGYVSGETEQAAQTVGCCFAPALFHVLPELGYKLSTKNSISFAFRLGLPVGADLPGHATAAPAGFLRFRHELDENPGGLNVSAMLGGGLIRHTVPLAGDMGTDTSATGPLLIGGGLGWSKPFGSMSFIAELNALAGIPIISEMGTCPGVGCVKPNFAVQLDANLGLQVGF